MRYHLVGTNCFPLVNFILQGYFLVGFFKYLVVILVYKVFITSFVIVQFVRYYISTIRFSQNGLVVLSNCHCFYLFCCFFDMFVYSSFTGMHHSCCTKICVWFVANKALQYTKEQNHVGPFWRFRNKLFSSEEGAIDENDPGHTECSMFVVLCLLLDKFLVQIHFLGTSTLKLWDVKEPSLRKFW